MTTRPMMSEVKNGCFLQCKMHVSRWGKKNRNISERVRSDMDVLGRRRWARWKFWGKRGRHVPYTSESKKLRLSGNLRLSRPYKYLFGSRNFHNHFPCLSPRPHSSASCIYWPGVTPLCLCLCITAAKQPSCTAMSR